MPFGVCERPGIRWQIRAEFRSPSKQSLRNRPGDYETDRRSAALTGNAPAQDPIGPADRATIKAIVVDARTGVPLSKVLVAVEGGASVETRQDGGFVLPDILPGEIHLSVSAVGYGLVQRTLHLARGGTADLTIPLSEGSATYTETVTVAADRFERPEPVPSQQTERSNHASSTA
jgi:hypothetical protein